MECWWQGRIDLFEPEGVDEIKKKKLLSPNVLDELHIQ